jgi:hypothetical protein
MKKIPLILLIGAIAIAAFLLGQRSRQAAPEPVASAPAAPATTGSAAASEPDRSSLPSSQPVRTFRGPDGLPHIIVYDPAKPPDNNDAEQVRAAVLEDMRNHPRNIVRSYDLTEAQIAEIVAGKRPVPDSMLPKPKPAAPAAR